MPYRAKRDFKCGGQDYWPGNRVEDEHVAGAEPVLKAMGYIEAIAADSGLTEPGTRPETEVAQVPDPVNPSQHPNPEDTGSLEWRAVTPEEDPSVAEPSPPLNPESHVVEFDPENPEASEPEPIRRAYREQEERDEAASQEATAGAQELADEHNVDLSTVEGSGKDGRVTKQDVQRAISDEEDADSDAGPGQSDAEQRANVEEQRQAEEQSQESEEKE